MKKLIVFLLVLSVLLPSCSVDTSMITPVAEGMKNTEYSAYDFSLRIELEKKTCVLLAAGDVVISENPKTVTAEIEEALFGDNVGVTQTVWQDGFVTTDGEKEELSWEEMRSSLIYAAPFVFGESEIKSASVGTTRDGTKYIHKIKNNVDNDMFYSLLGDTLPQICGVASVIEDETRFENIVCQYIIDEDGNPVSYSVTFTCLYQDTPPYVPGVKQNKDKYITQIDVEFRASYK